jgi:hypothetical protein
MRFIATAYDTNGKEMKCDSCDKAATFHITGIDSSAAFCGDHSPCVSNLSANFHYRPPTDELKAEWATTNILTDFWTVDLRTKKRAARLRMCKHRIRESIIECIRKCMKR